MSSRKNYSLLQKVLRENYNDINQWRESNQGLGSIVFTNNAPRVVKSITITPKHHCPSPLPDQPLLTPTKNTIELPASIAPIEHTQSANCQRAIYTKKHITSLSKLGNEKPIFRLPRSKYKYKISPFYVSQRNQSSKLLQTKSFSPKANSKISAAADLDCFLRDLDSIYSPSDRFGQGGITTNLSKARFVIHYSDNAPKMPKLIGEFMKKYKLNANLYKQCCFNRKFANISAMPSLKKIDINSFKLNTDYNKMHDKKVLLRIRRMSESISQTSPSHNFIKTLSKVIHFDI